MSAACGRTFSIHSICGPAFGRMEQPSSCGQGRVSRLDSLHGTPLPCAGVVTVKISTQLRVQLPQPPTQSISSSKCAAFASCQKRSQHVKSSTNCSSVATHGSMITRQARTWLGRHARVAAFGGRHALSIIADGISCQALTEIHIAVHV
eukprot:SAG31_NODE_829_length_11709_cov_5.435917_2_plen_149_part_00